LSFNLWRAPRMRRAVAETERDKLVLLPSPESHLFTRIYSDGDYKQKRRAATKATRRIRGQKPARQQGRVRFGDEIPRRWPSLMVGLSTPSANSQDRVRSWG